MKTFNSIKRWSYSLSGLVLAGFFLLQGQVAADDNLSEIENSPETSQMLALSNRKEDSSTINNTPLETTEISLENNQQDNQLTPKSSLTTSDNTKSETVSSDQLQTLTTHISEKISQGSIVAEDDKIDTSLYNQPILNPDSDDDKDGIKNKDEVFIYKKGNQEFLGYYSHPKLEDSDGDGILDKEDTDKLKWNVSDRDLAMFMELSYRDDFYIDRVLNEHEPLLDLYQGRHEYAIMHKELAPFWKVAKSYHESDGLDAVLFETYSRFSYLPNKTVHVLAIRGTEKNSIKDLTNDLVILTGNNPKQASSIENVIRELSRDHSIQNLYITGHSLGGYLAQRATVELYQNYPDFYKKKFRTTTTFNAPKIITARTIWNANNGLWDKGLENKKLTREGKIKHYVTGNDSILGNNLRNDDDLVLNVGNSLFGHGSRYYVNVIFKINKFQNNFNIGKRNYKNTDGYQDPKLSSINFITKKSKTHIITRKQIQTTKYRAISKPKKSNSNKIIKKIRYPHQ